MADTDDIPATARKLAEDMNAWLKGGNSVGHLSEHAVDGLASTIAEALMAERERCAKIAEMHKDVRWLAPQDDWCANVGQRLAAAIRQP